MVESASVPLMLLNRLVPPEKGAIAQAGKSIESVFESCENLYRTCRNLSSPQDLTVECAENSLSVAFGLTNEELSEAPVAFFSLLTKSGVDHTSSLAVELTFIEAIFEDEQGRLEVSIKDGRGIEFFATTDAIGEYFCSLNYDWQMELAESLEWMDSFLSRKEAG